MSAGSGGDRNLFSVAQSETLRIQVSVPQNYAVDLHPGQDAEVTLRERAAKLPRENRPDSQSISAATRTLLTEVQVDNSSGRLLPGMYAEVKFSCPEAIRVVLIPGSSLVANAQGTTVACDHCQTGGCI